MRQRRLAGLERAWLAADRLCPPFVNQLVLEGTGTIDVEAWRTALGSVPHPGAALRLAGRWWVDGPAPRVRVEEGPWDGHTPHPALSRPLDPYVGPITELVLWPGEPPRILLRTHHAALDGRGAWALIADVGRALRGERPLGAEAGPTRDVDLCGDAEAIGDPPADRPAPTGSPAAGAFACTWARARVPRIDRPVTARVLAALFEASRAHTDEPLRVSVSVDLRRHRPRLRSSANLSGILRLDVGHPDVSALDRRLRDALQRGDERGVPVGMAGASAAPTFVASWVGGRAARRSLRTGRFPVSATLSNLGRHDLREVSGGGFEARRAVWIPPGSPGMPLFLTLTGHDEGVELCATAPDGLASGGRLAGLLADLASHLTA